jgi:hypothetical protein
MSADLSFSLSGGTDFNCLIVFGPIAMSWGTSATLAGQFKELKQHFHLSHVVMVGDRGMIAQARITEDIAPAGMDWITALRAPAIRALLDSGALQLSLLDQRDMASIAAPDFPNERLVVCRNPDLAAEVAVDGVYVIRASLPVETFDETPTVHSNKSLACVERFRCSRLSICAGLLPGWHMRQRLAPVGATHEQARVWGGPAVTTGGVMSGIDFALRFVAGLAGDDVTRSI